MLSLPIRLPQKLMFICFLLFFIFLRTRPWVRRTTENSGLEMDTSLFQEAATFIKLNIG